MVNSGTISASLAGSKVTVAGQLTNYASGHLLSGAGALMLANLQNFGDVKAAGAGTIAITGGVSNEDGQIQATTGGTIAIAGEVSNDAGGMIRAVGSKSMIEIAAGVENDGTIEASTGGTIDALVAVNSGRLWATGMDSILNVSFTGTGDGNRGWIIADEDGKVTVESSLTNASGGKLKADDGGEIEVHGAVKGGIAWLSGDDLTLDLQGSTTEDTTAQVSFLDDGIAHLMLDHSSRFAGTVAGLGEGDTIDVTDIAFVDGASHYDQASRQLLITDGTHLATIQLLGKYAASQFAFSSDGHGGTLITGQAAATPMADLGTLVAAHA